MGSKLDPTTSQYSNNKSQHGYYNLMYCKPSSFSCTEQTAALFLFFCRMSEDSSLILEIGFQFSGQFWCSWILLKRSPLTHVLSVRVVRASKKQTYTTKTVLPSSKMKNYITWCYTQKLIWGNVESPSCCICINCRLNGCITALTHSMNQCLSRGLVLYTLTQVHTLSLSGWCSDSLSLCFLSQSLKVNNN